MASASGRRKQLLAHLDAAFVEIERLSTQLRDGVARLEAAAAHSDLSPASAADWFRTYLRLADLSVEIRRGEQRHRSSRPLLFPCMHTTGAKHARHSGLSIDDANAIYLQLETTPGVKEAQLESAFMRMDALDRDGLGRLDARLAAALALFLRQPSAYYARVEVSGSDPHQEMKVLARNASLLAKAARACFSAATCLCLPDATPWTTFRLEAGDAPSSSAAYADVDDEDVDAFAQSAISAVATHALDSEIGLAELKRQYGFDVSDSSHDHDHDHAHAHAADNSTNTSGGGQKRRRTTATATASPPPGRPPQPPREIYRRKCQERGLARKRKIEELLALKGGALELDLSHFGFHAPQDLQDVLDVVVEAQVPVRLVDVTNNFFDARSFAIFCELLRLPLLRAHLRTLKLRCMALPQRSDFAALLRILTDADMGALARLASLDLSYNTFFEDAVLSLNDLLSGLANLETLSLESCFPKAPDPGVVEVAVVKDLVRAALVTCCDRLQSLNFGSNWMSFPLLNALFAAESALQELQIAQMTFFYFEAPDAAPLSWKFSFQRQRRITLSETRGSRAEYLPFFLDALTYCLKMRMAQLEHLDLWVVPPQQRKSVSDDALHGALGGGGGGGAMGAHHEMQLDDRVTGLLQAFTEYGALRSARLRFELSARNVKSRLVLAQLFRDGLKHCEALELALAVPLSLADLRDLLARLDAPQLRSLKLSVRLLPSSSESQQHPRLDDFGRVFRSAVAALTELTLDFKVELKRSKALLPDAVVQEMETAWRSLGDSSSHSGRKNTRSVSLVKRKTKKSDSGGGGSDARDLVTFAFLFTGASPSRTRV